MREVIVAEEGVQDFLALVEAVEVEAVEAVLDHTNLKSRVVRVEDPVAVEEVETLVKQEVMDIMENVVAVVFQVRMDLFGM